MDTFELTSDHIKLLQAMYVEWEDGETGAPAIDSKRPYGNSWVPGDVAEILGMKYDHDDNMSEEMQKLCYNIHSETETALQIVLNTLSFEPGLYKRTEKYCTRSWTKIMSDTELKLRKLQTSTLDK